MPYVDSLDFEQAFNNRVEGDITVMLPKTLSIESAELNATPEGGESDHVKLYVGRLNQDRDPRLRFEIAGDPFATNSGDSGALTGDGLLAALLAVIAAAVALPAGFALWRRRAPDQSGRLTTWRSRSRNWTTSMTGVRSITTSIIIADASLRPNWLN